MASAALQRAADELERAAGDRQAAAALAATRWRGTHRLTFNVDLRNPQTAAAALAAAYRGAAARIQQAGARAAEEQAHRERERAVAARA
ncbi:MAG: hypothetical protein RMM29_09805 [Planctomycetota bacterium]|nr:hypothetical protein [Planctomycetota bacterium]